MSRRWIDDRGKEDRLDGVVVVVVVVVRGSEAEKSTVVVVVVVVGEGKREDQVERDRV